MTLLVASLAGAFGAVCRYLLSGWAQEGSTSGLPVGTLTVNILGALTLGIVVGVGSPESCLTLAVAGFCGGFTTFSTWTVETIRLGPRSPRAILNLAVTLLGGLAAGFAGYTLVS